MPFSQAAFIPSEETLALVDDSAIGIKLILSSPALLTKEGYVALLATFNDGQS